MTKRAAHPKGASPKALQSPLFQMPNAENPVTTKTYQLSSALATPIAEADEAAPGRTGPIFASRFSAEPIRIIDIMEHERVHLQLHSISLAYAVF